MKGFSGKEGYIIGQDFYKAVSLGLLLSECDKETYEHSKNVAELLNSFAAYFPEIDPTTAYIAGLLHDIGKLYMKKIINLPRRLTNEEMKIVKKHPLISASILGKLEFMPDIIEAVKYHHERYDGSGYPKGKKADEIPFLAQLLSIADTYDAIISERSYKESKDQKYALMVLESNLFNPKLVSIFKKILPRQERLIGVNAG